MQMLIDIQPPFPAPINQSYIPFGFYKFGCCCWTYDGGYDGEVEWINTQHFVTEPKLTNPVSFRYFFHAGVIAIVTPRIVINQNIPDISIQGKFYNPTNGLGMPAGLPYIN